MKKIVFVLLSFTVFLLSNPALAIQLVTAKKVTTPPVIDGIANDTAWEAAPKTVTNDKIANIPIELQAIYTNENIYLKIRFPDSTENRAHKLLEWDPQVKAYRTGPKREDIFCVKWNMEAVPIDLSLASETPYHADIWLWKAFRTDPVGYSDDKQHIYGEQETEKAKKLITPMGKIMFLSRPSDGGTSTYKDLTYVTYAGDSVVRYEHRQPKGSRADVRARGVWKDGFWTIEFERKLNTGHPDDVQFNPDLSYTFGVSRYEIAAKKPKPSLEQPNYESGDISEILTLEFR